MKQVKPNSLAEARLIARRLYALIRQLPADLSDMDRELAEYLWPSDESEERAKWLT